MTIKKALFCYFSPLYQKYVPLDIGLYFALIKKKNIKVDLETQRLGFKEKDYLQKITKHNPQIIVFILDNITWSGMYAYAMAFDISKKLKEYNPTLIIGFQSYKISSDEINNALQIIDFIININPEHAFSNIDKILNKEFVNGVYTKTYETHKSEQCDISQLPSPYLEGIFDSFIKSRATKNEVMYLITSRGCIYGCYYCHRSVKFEKIQYYPIKKVYDEIEYLFRRGINKLFIIDDCFITSAERLQEFESEFSKRVEKEPSLKKISIYIMIRPDLIDELIIQRLYRLNIKEVQLGLQTINPDLQYLMKREMELSLFNKIADLFHKFNIAINVDVIIGLPGDTLDFFKKSLDKAISMRPKGIQVKQLYLNPNTKLDEEKSKYGIIPYKNRNLGVPFIKKANNIDEKYKKNAYLYLQKKMLKHKDIKWRWATEYGTYHDLLL